MLDKIVSIKERSPLSLLLFLLLVHAESTIINPKMEEIVHNCPAIQVLDGHHLHVFNCYSTQNYKHYKVGLRNHSYRLNLNHLYKILLSGSCKESVISVITNCVNVLLTNYIYLQTPNQELLPLPPLHSRPQGRLPAFCAASEIWNNSGYHWLRKLAAIVLARYPGPRQSSRSLALAKRIAVLGTRMPPPPNS